MDAAFDLCQVVPASFEELVERHHAFDLGIGKAEQGELTISSGGAKLTGLLVGIAEHEPQIGVPQDERSLIGHQRGVHGRGQRHRQP